MERTSRAARLERLSSAQLYVLTDGAASADAFEQRIDQLVAAGVEIIQLRDKRLDDRTLLARARQLQEQTCRSPTLAIINDRPDIALLAHADGVHVGQDEIPVGDVRQVISGGQLVGISTHSMMQARRAVEQGADYLGCGPTFPSKTKTFVDFPGPEFLSAVAAEVSLPAFAIGGITLANLPQVLETGLRRIAVGDAVSGAGDVGRVVQSLLAQLRSESASEVRRLQNRIRPGDS